MLEIKNLTKKYEKTIAVDNVNFNVENGEVAILLGPNGAGKSTTIKSIAGLLRYEGSITIDGLPNKSIEAKKIFSYVPEAPSVYDMLTVKEHLEFIAKAYKINNYEEKAEELLKKFDLWDKQDKLGTELSKGMQQKVSVCCALLSNPKVILFDEPMIGLDPKAIKQLKNEFLNLKSQGCSVVISTHIIDSIEEIWDKALVMKQGKIVMSRSRADIEQRNESLEDLFFEVTEG